ncbi:MAG: cytochrome c biogenesis protein CcsA [Azonexus sp.]|nr:cytochrome c biogenesis protein CcsA [Azonexus sp.]
MTKISLAAEGAPPLGVAVAVCLLLWLWPQAGNALLWLAAAGAVLGAVRPARRLPLWRAALGILAGAGLALAAHFLADHFQLRAVWLYSSAALPPYLKAANVWGGDEGTMLLLATFCLAIAVRGAGLAGWSGRGGGLIAAWYTATAAWLGVFSATPAEWLASGASQGMNAHLQTFWMVLHAPLILAAYAWALAPAGAALAALERGDAVYGPIAQGYGRLAWLVLTAGIGFGMVWALEDFTFGQLWHWDPVQTAVFAVWALTTAVLHGARRWPGANQRLLPALSLLAAMLVCLALSVTRSETLSSSHRYIGTTSWLSHLLLAGALLGLTLWYLARSFRVGRGPATASGQRAATDWALDLAIWLFTGAALLAVGVLGKAYLYEWLRVAKSDDMMPFLETLMTWATTDELAELQRTFARWDVDGYALAAWLAPILALVGLIGGYVFLRRAVNKPLALGGSLLAAGLALLMVWRGGWLDRRYSGEGILSQSIVEVLPWFDAALTSGIFLLGASLLWCLMSLRRAWNRPQRLRVLRAVSSLTLIHGGAVVALVAGLTATVLNTYQSTTIPPDEALDQWHSIAGEMNIRIRPHSGSKDFSGYRAIADVELQTEEMDVAGQALFEDKRQLPPGYQGPVRQLCEILDYRYARHVRDPGYMLNPFIIRGWEQDTQVWLPATSRLLPGNEKEKARTVIVIRRYPFVSFVWAGLLAMALGGVLLPGLGRQNVSSLSQS